MATHAHWQDNWTENLKTVGFLPVYIDSEIYLCGSFSCKMDTYAQGVGRSEPHGEMRVFRPDGFAFERGDMLDMRWGQENQEVKVSDAIVREINDLPNYDKCRAADVHFVAEDLQISVIEKEINTTIKI